MDIGQYMTWDCAENDLARFREESNVNRPDGLGVHRTPLRIHDREPSGNRMRPDPRLSPHRIAASKRFMPSSIPASVLPHGVDHSSRYPALATSQNASLQQAPSSMSVRMSASRSALTVCPAGLADSHTPFGV